MAEQWVINASPLIVLCSIEREQLLFQLAEDIVIPAAVAVEIEQDPPGDKARQFLRASRLRIVKTPPASEELLAWDLGAGETSVIAYAYEHTGYTAILDDHAARRCAQVFSVQTRGTLGIVISARQRGLIPSASSVLRELLTIGFYLDERVIAEALRKTVGEDWQ